LEEDDNDDNNSPKEEVNYHVRARRHSFSPKTDWRRALHDCPILTEPSQNVVSSLGTVETTFNWALAAFTNSQRVAEKHLRLISALLSAFRNSVRARRSLGELPCIWQWNVVLHPEVVNLLVAAHWLGITAVDQSGRTPLEILNDTEIAMEDHKVVFDSSTRSQTANEIIKAQTEVDVCRGIMQKGHSTRA
jgi:hypothetical protein